MIDPDLLERVDSLAPAPFDGELFRHVAPSRDPMPAEGARIHGGRWNPPDSYPTLYLASDRLTARLELERLAWRFGVTVPSLLPREVYSCNVRLVACLDLRSSNDRASVGLPDEALSSDNLATCMAYGLAAHFLGFEGVLATSATGAGTAVAVFLDNVQTGSVIDAEIVETWRTTGDLPSSDDP